MNRSTLALVLTVLAASLAGCQGPQQFTTRTTLYSDGRVERSIYQPVKATPAPAQKAGVWTKKDLVKGKPDEVVDGKPQPMEYIQAEGTFASVKDLPDTLFVQRQMDNKLLAPLLPGAKLKRAYQKDDFVFVTEHRWNETLTDSISIGSLRQGLDEAISLGVTVGEDVFNELDGKDYDVGELAHWLRTEGKTWVMEVADYGLMYWLSSQRPGTAKSKRPGPAIPFNDPDLLAAFNGFADICDRHGLKLRENGLPILDQKKLGKIVEEFTIDLICAKVRDKKTKKLVSRETVLGWAKELEAAEKARPANAPKNRIELAGEKVINEKYGGKEVFQMKLGVVGLKMTGVHLFGESRKFDYTLTMPGTVIETNGAILAGNRVGWKFMGQDAWLLGYPMSCRSLESHAELQKQLLKGQPLTAPEAMLEFINLLAQDNGLDKSSIPPLGETLKKCRTQKSMAPLHKHREEMLNTGQGHQVQRVDALLKLLKLPADAK